MKLQPEISAVTGTYNRFPLLTRFVDSVRASVGALPYEIILVDGGSTDGTQDWAKEQPDVVLIEQGELLGAIKAFNAGCEVARGRYVAILNDDVEIQGDTLKRAHQHLEEHPAVGQVAFRNIVKGTADKNRRPISSAYGYMYGQCCMTRRWLGEHAGWWGDEGMRTYGGDTRFSLRLWEMGWPTVAVDGCAVIDHVHEDELRQINSDAPRAGGKAHPDLTIFSREWNNRLPHKDWWIQAPVNKVLAKAPMGNLRTLRFKGMMNPANRMRHALIDEFAKLGTAKQVNQMAEQRKHGTQGYQKRVKDIVRNFRPDLVMFQAQRENNVLPETVLELRRIHPNTIFLNWDGDCHFPLTPFHFEIARAVHLQLTLTPTLFPEYAAQGIGVAYWPIGLEMDYAVDRAKVLDGPDVLFLGALYGEGVFPEAINRREAVKALWAQRDFTFKLHGKGWHTVGIKVSPTNEAHAQNAKLMARTKMTLSISQASHFWGYTSDRLYNICATGCPALVQRFAGMEHHGFVDGETCIAWGTIPEMLNKARYYLKHKEKRERIGLAGQKMTLSRHTWAHRIEGLFAMLEGLR